MAESIRPVSKTERMTVQTQMANPGTVLNKNLRMLFIDFFLPESNSKVFSTRIDFLLWIAIFNQPLSEIALKLVWIGLGKSVLPARRRIYHGDLSLRHGDNLGVYIHAVYERDIFRVQKESIHVYHVHVDVLKQRDH